MKKLLVAAALAGLVGTANAQSAFEGFYGQVGIGYEMVSPSLSYGNLNITNNIDSILLDETCRTERYNYEK